MQKRPISCVKETYIRYVYMWQLENPLVFCRYAGARQRATIYRALLPPFIGLFCG